ncbi:MAG: hypothetical protein F2923_07525 [Actinobacteria bacterium]|uniref:Unannotated protein n=1 Tax=freshwater metagenome TaxID=449393 RepID=A0A6J7GVC7_9ZZZZ|nr:hypothetical protein [Actinomycetota bacterium]MTB28473.1 hypothetical protein [Actinomycetota bacterium]
MKHEMRAAKTKSRKTVGVRTDTQRVEGQRIKEPRSDEGSVLILGIGLVGVCLLSMAVVIDTTSAFLQRRSLYSLADSAALAGAQVIDLASYYANGAGEGTRLDSGAVARRTRAFLLADAIALEHPGFQIDAVTTDGITVQVDLSSPINLPFLGALRTDVIQVRSTARLDYRPSGLE